MDPRKKIIILTAPSGAGKTSITRYLLKRFPALTFSISAATREKRAHETDGVDYYFLSPETFKEKIRNNEFLEWEMVYEGKYYGTLLSEMERIWSAGKIPLLDIDVKGALHIQQQYPENTVSIFVEPPSVEELRRRLEARGTETPETLQDRVNKAAYEISFKNQFKELIINDNLENACQRAEALVKAYTGLQ